MTDTREHAHDLIDRLPDTQLSALVGLLESFADPLSVTLSDAPFEDEEISREEEQAVAESREWFKHHQGIPFEDVVAELGFHMDQIRGNNKSA